MKASLTSSSSPELKTSESWKAVASGSRYWRAWDGEIVVYDDLSGDTLKLDPVMAEAFSCLLRGHASVEELRNHIADTFDLEADQKLQYWMDKAIAGLQRSGLIELAGPGTP